ncbi:hypothetical protein AERO9A_140116 [Aeromonas salmonicida]|nr:hypothetical protein AERO9A_140116 [Aeromonas salmonicida]
MEGGIRPIFWGCYQPMFDGVDMYVIEVIVEIILIPDQMFPIAPLPNTSFTTTPTRF